MSKAYRIYVYLQGDTRMVLCEVDTPEAVLDIVGSLCTIKRPQYTRVEIEIYEPVSPAR